MPNLKPIWENKSFILEIAVSVFLCLATGGSLNYYDLSLILALVLPFILVFYRHPTSKNLLRNQDFYLVALLGILLGCLLMTSSFRYLLKLYPTILVFTYAIIVAKHFDKSKAILIYIIPLILITSSNYFSIYNSWVHKIEFGEYQGRVIEPYEVPEFLFTNRANEEFSGSDLLGKYTVLDFWFIGCKDCYMQFPKAEQFYWECQKKDVSFYAVNRPRPSDDSLSAFLEIDKLSYSFPVLKSDKKSLEKLDIYVYPTTIIINPQLEIVFKGELKEARDFITSI